MHCVGGRSTVVKTQKEDWVWTEGRVLHSRETELFPLHIYREAEGPSQERGEAVRKKKFLEQKFTVTPVSGAHAPHSLSVSQNLA